MSDNKANIEHSSAEKQLIENCVKGKLDAQEKLYKMYSSRMLGVCLRYAKNKMEAEDIMQDGFIKVYQNLKHFRNDGSLEGWIRRIMVNTSINYCKKNLKHTQTIDIEECYKNDNTSVEAIDTISVKTLLSIVQKLPEGYKMVFNLYAIEGYSHKEIAEALGITENTSKSQLSRARKILQEKIKAINNICYEQIA